MGNGWNKTNPFYSILMCTFTYDNFLRVWSRPELSEVQCFRTFLCMGLHRWELLLINTGSLWSFSNPSHPGLASGLMITSESGIYCRKPRSTWSDMTVCLSEKRGNLLYWTWRNESHPFFPTGFFFLHYHILFSLCAHVYVCLCVLWSWRIICLTLCMLDKQARGQEACLQKVHTGKLFKRNLNIQNESVLWRTLKGKRNVPIDEVGN